MGLVGALRTLVSHSFGLEDHKVTIYLRSLDWSLGWEVPPAQREERAGQQRERLEMNKLTGSLSF